MFASDLGLRFTKTSVRNNSIPICSHLVGDTYVGSVHMPVDVSEVYHPQFGQNLGPSGIMRGFKEETVERCNQHQLAYCQNAIEMGSLLQPENMMCLDEHARSDPGGAAYAKLMARASHLGQLRGVCL